LKRRVEIGILYSRSGNYRLVSDACRAGALAAIADINGDPSIPALFSPVKYDPQGNADGYASDVRKFCKAAAQGISLAASLCGAARK